MLLVESVADPEPYVLGLPDPEGPKRLDPDHQAKIVEKPLIPIVL
jgi:hypothetical protein